MRAAMDTLLLRLTAVEAMVMQKPIITGRYTGSPWLNLAQPLSELVGQQMDDLVALGEAVRAVTGSVRGLCGLGFTFSYQCWSRGQSSCLQLATCA